MACDRSHDTPFKKIKAQKYAFFNVSTSLYKVCTFRNNSIKMYQKYRPIADIALVCMEVYIILVLFYII